MLDPNEERIPARVPSAWYEAAIARAQTAEEALAMAVHLLRGWSIYNVASKELQAETREFLADGEIRDL